MSEASEAHCSDCQYNQDIGLVEFRSCTSCSTADMQEVREALQQPSPGSHAVMSGLMSACQAIESLQPGRASPVAWQFYQHAANAELVLGTNAQTALWRTQTGETCCAVLCCAVRCGAVLCGAVLCCAVLCGAVLNHMSRKQYALW